MPTLKQWAAAHGVKPVSRVVSRIERFAGNTTDTEVQSAATELIDMLKEALPTLTKDEE